MEAELAVATAHALAYRGELARAQVILERLVERGSAGRYAWDLLARIHAQRGDVAIADRYWQQVQASDPGDEMAAAGRRAIAVIASRRRVTR